MWSRVSWTSLCAVLAGVGGVVWAFLGAGDVALALGLLGVIFALLALGE